ncbi:laminin G domain protein [Dictyocaulus viviparus]|uniref:Laminin G domain protein n=1 Tax=Dictyocaulus viviparus TaxID=29172 RepID=A0A0D8XQ82_DICVI|nr:laminin G domain protein [Dictyocaulus viviparus]
MPSVAYKLFTELSRDECGAFRINRQSDPKRQFTIDQDGTLRVAQRLDREDISSYKLIIEAFDTAGNVGTQLVAVYLRDVNDNGPEPYTVPKFCVFPENTPVNQQGTCEIRCTDKDSPEFGPPFNMQLDQNKWKYADYLSVTFDAHGDGGNGSMTIRPLVVFDREAINPGKILEIPLILTDRADRTNQASVHVIIGDENDNPMHDGNMVITVNSYLGKLKRTQIGRVYVEDLDDWDLGDKTFTWKESLPGFELSSKGEITMDANMPPGTYHISSNVHDNRRNENAVGFVTVNVFLVPELAFLNQGSMQLLLAEGSNLQVPEDFIRVNDSGNSMLSVFTQEMVKYLGGNVALDVFSIQLDYATLQTRTVPVLNIRFSAHGSPYRDSVQLNGLISANRDQLQSKMGATIVGNGVVVSANSTVLVGINAQSRDECTCPVWRPPTQCQFGLCHNDGVCHNTHPGFFCECRNDLLKGSRCQGTTRSFSGDGFAWYKAMPACTSLNISMQFMTLYIFIRFYINISPKEANILKFFLFRQQDAILFYNGPMDTKTSEDQIEYRDYIIIHLRAGRLVMEMSMNGIAPVNLEVASTPLNDGTWHELAVTQIGKAMAIFQYIEMVVDQCRYLGPRSDDSACRESLYTPDDDERLNIVTPVQIGGLAPLSSGQNYPLAVPRTALNGCGSTPLIPKCICDPGWDGARCEKKIEWIQIQSGGFINYMPKIAFPEQTNDIELLFIPGRVNGAAELTYGSDKSQNYVSTSVEMTSDGLTPVAKFDLGGVRNSLTQLRMPNLSLKENASYWLRFTRNPTRASLSIDNSYYISHVLDPTISSQSFSLQVNELFLGTHSGGRGFQGCVGTYRWSNQNLPLRQQSNKATDLEDESIVSIMKSEGVVDGCNLLITCAQLPMGYCGGTMVCVDFWKGAFCTCPEGANAMLGDDGQLVGCGETLAVAKLGISNPAIILILVSLVLLIMLVMLMLVYARRQTTPFESVRPEDLNRDNLRPYAIEGGGEADNDQYSIANLRKPVMPIEGNGLSLGPPVPLYSRPPIDERLRSQLNDLESDQNAAPFDEIRIYEDEKDTVSVVTLESLGSIPDAERQPDNWEQRFPS